MLELTKDRVGKDANFKKNYKELQKAYNKYLSFRHFIMEEFADIIPLELEEKEMLKGKGTDD